MPVYDMKCDNCGAVYMDKYFRSIKERRRFICVRAGCLGYTEPIIPSSVMINLDSTFEGWDHVLEVNLRGGSHRKEVMKERGLEERDKVRPHSDKGKWH